MNRREMLKWTLGATLVATTPGLASAGNLVMPPEWGPHARCFMALCAAHDLYDEAEIQAIREAQARAARAIARFEPVTMLTNTEDLTKARSLCGRSVTILEMDHYDVWTRDTLPTFVRSDSGLKAVCWNFNTWGGKFPDDEGYTRDETLAVRFADSLGIQTIKADMVGEGGAIETDGNGTLLTTETCLLNPNRNPGMSRRDVENELMRLTGCRKIIWLKGSESDTITDGHIDGIARFIKPGVVIAEVSQDPYDPEYDDLQFCARQLENSRDANGNKLEVIRLNRPHPDRMVEHGPDFSASYINCYEANNGIVMPAFGDEESDQAAYELFSTLRPHHKIVQIDVDAICEGGGGIHCNTQQLPKF